MTNYYIENDNKLLIFSADKTVLKTTLKHIPDLQGLEIKETERPIAMLNNEYVFADTDEYLQAQAQNEAQRIALLNLTAADVERAIYKAKGMDFEDIIAYLEAQPLSDDGQPVVDIKALKIELKANYFYRGNPYVEKIGQLLGFTDEQLDSFFEDGDYTKLLEV